MNELTCQECGSRWYSASRDFENGACDSCGGRLSASRAADAPRRRFARKSRDAPSETHRAPEAPRAKPVARDA